MTIFSCDNLTKQFEVGVLFDGISFGLEQGEKLGIIGRNGAGKTTLLNIIASIDSADEGSVVFNSSVHFEYLTQEPIFDKDELVIDCVMNAKQELNAYLEEYHRLCNQLKQKFDEGISNRIQELTTILDSKNAWNLETEAKIILSKLGIEELHKPIKELSGGLKKRVALARALLSNPDLLILDEPTNHLDADSVQWLQDRLSASGNSILFVTHDRYFLDAIATRILEIDRKKVYSYPGNYEKYLERREAFLSSQESTIIHTISRLRQELAWLQKGAKARRTKQKSRIDWVEKLKNEVVRPKLKDIKIELGKTFVGSRIIDAVNISKEIAGKQLFQNFTYIAKPGDKIGIIGPNGSGKSTLLNVLVGEIKSDTGTIKIGTNAAIGYFTQEISNLKDSDSVIGSLRQVAEYIDVGIGRDRFLTAKDLLERFQFPNKQHSALIGTLSGGEKRRLALLKVLMANPNVILLDEPTNDFDIQTLNAFEEYLEDFYGTLLIVSHDRSFLDKTVTNIWSFDGKGNIKEYPGNYSNYLEKKEEELKQKRMQEKEFEAPKKVKYSSPSQKKRLSYMEEREQQQLEKEIEKIEKDLENLHSKMNSGKINDYKELEQIGISITELEQVLEFKTDRWFELSNRIE
ncbi:MAG: ABC-F family ATP-binding cassette domain-containing protein [Ignavibacteria bacterium]|nr:ABC-F family ATP-binding cassette domain-containing protein [Ignavibacteria bacterium]